jgi:DNA-binding HxlR family transcriptional regulator
MARGDFDETCPSRQLMEFMSDKWIPSLMHHLGDGARRPSELARRMPRISQKMLTQTLRNMEKWGLVTRTDFDESPPRVEYELSALGQRFTEPFDLICDWAIANEDMIFRLTAARRAAL